ncbi:MAG: HEAT repeat domain-containing protein [Phycisphaerales bacterium]|nr:MAG: HEAT repeat domain-containing protein [Phycisphaerales bacterium]
MTKTLILVVALPLVFPVAALARSARQKTAGEENQAAQSEVINRHIECLSDPNEHARRNAASILAEFGPAAKAAVDELIHALSDKTDADLRMYAARALGAIGPDAYKAVPALRRALSERSDFGSRFVRQEAARALGRIGPEAAGVAVNDLLVLLGDDDRYVRRAASNALALLGKQAVPGLIKSLEHPNPEVRYRATTALARMRHAAREALEKALESDNVVVRRGAARAFASYYVSPQVEAVPKLIKSLQDQDAVVRQWAATALTECVADSDAAMTALVEELKKDNGFAFEIVVLLSRTASRQNVLDKLLQAIDHAPSSIVRAQLIRSIGLAGPNARKAVPALQEALDDEQVGLRAAEALFRIAPDVDEVKRQIDAYFKRHKLEGPYPGYSDDLRLARRRMEFDGPAHTFFTPEAVAAAGRIFGNVDFVGKTKREVFAVLGELKEATARDESSEEVLVYRVDTGLGGMEYRLLFKSGRVHSVKTFGLD